MEPEVTYTWKTEPYGSVYRSDVPSKRWVLTRVLIPVPGGFEGIEAFEMVNLCEHCGRGDMREIGPQSFEQAVERGWLREVEEGT